MKLRAIFERICSCEEAPHAIWHVGRSIEYSRLEMRCLKCGRNESVGFQNLQLEIFEPGEVEDK